MVEIWKPVVGWKGYYEVSHIGRVRSLARVVMRSNGRPFTVHEHILSPRTEGVPSPITGEYHYIVALIRNGFRIERYIHHLVLEAFVGPRPHGMERRHLDGHASNNHWRNLAWGNRSQNREDIREHIGHIPAAKGVDNGNAKLNNSVVKRIRAWYGNGSNGFSQQTIADMFGVNQTLISAIVRKRAWKHVV